MSNHHDEETRTLLSNEGDPSLPSKVDKLGETWVQQTVTSRSVYLMCFFFLALNAGLLAASWRAQGEIRSVYSTMGRDIENLPRPDPFAGLSEAAKSNAGGLPLPSNFAQVGNPTPDSDSIAARQASNFKMTGNPTPDSRRRSAMPGKNFRQSGNPTPDSERRAPAGDNFRQAGNPTPDSTRRAAMPENFNNSGNQTPGSE
ncbi:hypothetical protein D9756_009978 [Leucocoprinus leucothites]|uniref:Uncharacterized protein n=1 Tax=Leucocoprinus leucothites TaxID=201217 RepID=A0A8H5CUI7_9AGAR|nr:hypothetical protein D9756_009978 [Leucoagaricus leucothites]